MAIRFIILKLIQTVLNRVNMTIDAIKTNKILFVIQTLIAFCINLPSVPIKCRQTKFTIYSTFQTTSFVKCKILRTGGANLFIHLFIILAFIASYITLQTLILIWIKVMLFLTLNTLTF